MLQKKNYVRKFFVRINISSLVTHLPAVYRPAAVQRDQVTQAYLNLISKPWSRSEGLLTSVATCLHRRAAQSQSSDASSMRQQ
jgi:hypothetical protein